MHYAHQLLAKSSPPQHEHGDTLFRTLYRVLQIANSIAVVHKNLYPSAPHKRQSVEF